AMFDPTAAVARVPSGGGDINSGVVSAHGGAAGGTRPTPTGNGAAQGRTAPVPLRAHRLRATWPRDRRHRRREGPTFRWPARSRARGWASLVSLRALRRMGSVATTGCTHSAVSTRPVRYRVAATGTAAS